MLHNDFDKVMVGDKIAADLCLGGPEMILGVVVEAGSDRVKVSCSKGLHWVNMAAWMAEGWCVLAHGDTEKTDKDPKPSENTALRFNEGKPRFDLLEPAAMEMLAQVFTYGATKYESHNWLRGMEWSKMDASLQRHLNAWRAGEDNDAESGLPHMAHVAWNAMALMSYEIHNIGKDDRIAKVLNK